MFLRNTLASVSKISGSISFSSCYLPKVKLQKIFPEAQRDFLGIFFAKHNISSSSNKPGSSNVCFKDKGLKYARNQKKEGKK